MLSRKWDVSKDFRDVSSYKSGKTANVMKALPPSQIPYVLQANWNNTCIVFPLACLTTIEQLRNAQSLTTFGLGPIFFWVSTLFSSRWREVAFIRLRISDKREKRKSWKEARGEERRRERGRGAWGRVRVPPMTASGTICHQRPGSLSQRLKSQVSLVEHHTVAMLDEKRLHTTTQSSQLYIHRLCPWEDKHLEKRSFPF